MYNIQKVSQYNTYFFPCSFMQHPDSAGNQFSGHFEVTASSSGVYVCKREVIYPPPFTEDCHSTEVKVDSTEVKVDGTIHDQNLI